MQYHEERKHTLMKILVLNCGSSSLKYQLINMDDETVMAKGYFEKIGHFDSFITHKVHGENYKYDVIARDHKEAINFVLKQFVNPQYPVINSLEEIDAIGHRIVHGGERFNASAIINESVKEGIREAIKFAPLHNPAHLAGIVACEKDLPGKPNIAVFDTAFHQTITKERFLYPIPYQYYERYSIRKYGAHGTSHQYVAQRVSELINQPLDHLKIINCHIGSGVSLCAIEHGISVDTTMGLTPLGGVAMGSRSGDLDPSIITFLMEKEDLNPAQMNDILNKQSGILGLSGLSSDNRDIEKAISLGDERAKDSLREYDYIIAQYIAKMAAAMNGVDVLTFTAGVGEKGPISRKDICSHLEFMGIKIDPEKNETVINREGEISSDDSPVKIWVVPTNEELMIAREVKNLVTPTT